MRRTIWLALALAYAGSVPAMAWQDAVDEEPEGEICLAVGHRWSGTAEERRRIKVDPVPASFRRVYAGTGCERFQLMVDSLLSWHLVYGDAASANAAVAFLELGAGGGRPIDPRFEVDLRARWRAAAKEVAKLLAATKPQSENETAAARLDRRYLAIYKLPTVKRLAEYIGRLDGYNFVASEYVRAAMQFPSPALVAGARRVEVPVAAGMALVRERAALGPVDAYLAERFGQFFDSRVQSPALREVSLAVTDVALNPTPATIAKADSVILAHDNPDFLIFLHHAYEEDSQACEVDDREAFPDYQDRCEENGFESDALGFWFERSRLKLTAERNNLSAGASGRIPGSGHDVVAATIELFQRRAWEEGWRYGEGSPSLQAFDLMLLRAEARMPNADKMCRGEIDDPTNHMPDILDDLIDAGTMVSPARDPGRYRRLAQTYLPIYDAVLRCDPEYSRDEHVRHAQLMRAYLASYNDLIGADR